ncbi:hypothetical protein PAPYR_5651 [Paratrimastix pyriformis]|uniref:Uncharacterized protein n=1 Tax=Paratrimastix pyriformis TaxID=342808 RepID=A0ABQ8UHG0_9EUKA|nr:hypothetical protein PAPYR_5651 [Paratrimastix pyriformis]
MGSPEQHRATIPGALPPRMRAMTPPSALRDRPAQAAPMATVTVTTAGPTSPVRKPLGAVCPQPLRPGSLRTAAPPTAVGARPSGGPASPEGESSVTVDTLVALTQPGMAVPPHSGGAPSMQPHSPPPNRPSRLWSVRRRSRTRRLYRSHGRPLPHSTQPRPRTGPSPRRGTAGGGGNSDQSPVQKHLTDVEAQVLAVGSEWALT